MILGDNIKTYCINIERTYQWGNKLSVVGIFHLLRDYNKLFIEKGQKFIAIHIFFKAVQFTFIYQPCRVFTNDIRAIVLKVYLFTSIFYGGEIMGIVLISAKVEKNSCLLFHQLQFTPGGFAIPSHFKKHLP